MSRLAALVVVSLGIALRSADGATFTVDSAVDDVDASPGDGVCATANGECTLRAAIQEANAWPQDDPEENTVDVPAGIYTLSLPGTGEDAAATGDLDITRRLTLRGAGAGSTVIDGARLDAVLQVLDFPTTVADLTIRNGLVGISEGPQRDIFTITNTIVADNVGAGIFGGGGSLTSITGSTIERNGGRGIANLGFNLWVSSSVVRQNQGGGITAGGDGEFRLTDSIVEDNVAPGGGAGLCLGAITNAFITLSTIARNTAGGSGGGIAHEFNNECTVGAASMTRWSPAAVFALLQVTDSTIVDNIAGEDGGGVWALRGMTMDHSTVAGNHAAQDGGGIWSSAGVAPILRVNESTVNSNTAGRDGGGIFDLNNDAGSAIVNSTVSGNCAGRDGGGIWEQQASPDSFTLPLANVTVTANVADSDADGNGDGGGVFTSPGGIALKNTILAENTDRGSEATDCAGTVVSDGFNLLGDPAGCTLGGSGSGDRIGLDPRLGPLNDNGGPTQTHALLPGSPAIEAGDPGGCTDAEGTALSGDQRGVTRPQGPRCDIGAYEAVCDWRGPRWGRPE